MPHALRDSPGQRAFSQRSYLGRRNHCILARQGGGPQRYSSSGPGGQRDGWKREGSSQPSSPKPRPALLVSLDKAGLWWQKNVFQGAKIGPVELVKLLNGQAARPGHAAAGKPIEVITNHVLLDVKVRAVAQYEVRMFKQPSAKDSTLSGADPSANSAGGSGSDGGAAHVSEPGRGKRGGGSTRGPRKDRSAKVVGTEARAVLSYLLDGDTSGGSRSAARNGWVYDSGAALYTVLLDDLTAAAVAAGAAGVGIRQLDGSVMVEVPEAAGAEAGGSTYKVELRRTGVIDAQQCIRDTQELRQQRMAASAMASREAAASAPSVAAPTPASSSEEAAAEPPADPDEVPVRAPPLSSEAAALAVLELVSRAEAAWDPDSVRVGAGAFVSYRQEDKNTRVSGFLPLKLLEGWRSAISVVAAGPTLSVDVAVSVVAEDGPLLPQLEKVVALKPGEQLAQKLREPRNAPALEAALKGLEVRSSANGIGFKLDGKLGKSAREAKFDDREAGKPVTVEKYFLDKYRIKLKHPDLPCLAAKNGKALLPIELLTVKRAQKRMSRLTERAKADFIRAAAKRPDDRLRAALQALRGPLKNLEGPVAKAFGLSLASGRNFLKVPGRLLPGPLLEVGNAGQNLGRGGLEPGNAGEWRLPGVVQPGVWSSGAVLSYLDSNKDADGLNDFLGQLRASLARQGAARMPADLPVVWASPPRGGRDPDKEAKEWLQKAAARAQAKYGTAPELVLVVLPLGRAGGDTYDSVKRAGDGKLGVATQCVQAEKAVPDKARGGPSASNRDLLALGVNAKVGGTTARLAGGPADWLPSLGGRRLMVLGADLSRGAAAAMGAAGGSSEDADEAAAGIEYAAVVGSKDSHCTLFNQALSAQSAGNRDLILGMKDSVAALLRQYAAEAEANRNPQSARDPGGPPPAPPPSKHLPAGSLPEALLMYRDGVSNSMFDAVLVHEYDAIKKACAEVGGPGYQPPVTFVVVQKSHNTRLYPARPADAHKSGNVPPGTLVDRDIVDPVAFDFFLNSHAGIQGTNRAPCYTVLVDEWGYSADDLPLLTFALCHTYPACNRALSVPPAARYAHKAADRARTALKDKVSNLRRGRTDWYELLDAPLKAASSVV